MSAASRSVNAAFIKSALEVKAQRDELAAALSDLLLCHSKGGFVKPSPKVIKAARSAIRKATSWQRRHRI
jgi:hypothetical protein